MVAHGYNISTGETEAGRSRVQGQLGLHRKICFKLRPNMVSKMAGQVMAPVTESADLILTPLGPTQFEGLTPYLIPPHSCGDPFITCIHTEAINKSVA